MPDRDDRSRDRPGPAGPAADAARTPEDRLADHAAIERLTGDLLPALVARLGATGLGELEVREGAWRVRLRRPAGAERRGPDRQSRGGRPGAPREARAAASPAADHDGSAGPARVSGGPSHEAPAGGPPGPGPLLATSPAVGIYHAQDDVRPGARVRGGERIGSVDLLGVPQDVLAPADAVVAATFVEDGDAVEYGQPLLALEPLATAGRDAGATPTVPA